MEYENEDEMKLGREKLKVKEGLGIEIGEGIKIKELK
jgi:hypothetical protein